MNYLIFQWGLVVIWQQLTAGCSARYCMDKTSDYYVFSCKNRAFIMILLCFLQLTCTSDNSVDHCCQGQWLCSPHWKDPRSFPPPPPCFLMQNMELCSFYSVWVWCAWILHWQSHAWRFSCCTHAGGQTRWKKIQGIILRTLCKLLLRVSHKFCLSLESGWIFSL